MYPENEEHDENGAKPEAEREPGTGRCAWSSKIRHAGRKGAATALRKHRHAAKAAGRRIEPMEVYHCLDCGGWHVGGVDPFAPKTTGEEGIASARRRRLTRDERTARRTRECLRRFPESELEHDEEEDERERGFALPRARDPVLPGA